MEKNKKYLGAFTHKMVESDSHTWLKEWVPIYTAKFKKSITGNHGDIFKKIRIKAHLRSI